MKKYILVIVLMSFIIPSVALASWWNPFTWNIFKRKVTPPVEVVVQEPVATSAVEKLEVKEESKKEVKQLPIISTSKKLQEVPKITPVVAPVITPVAPPPAPVGPTEAETKLYEQKLKELEAIRLKQKQLDTLTEKYNNDMDKIDQEILDIKTKFYKDVDANYNNPNVIGPVADRRYTALLNEANTKIDLLIIKSQQLSLDYKKAISK